MSLKTIRRLAAEIAGVGESHIKIMDAKRAGEALTRDDVRSLFSEGAVVAEHRQGVGRGKARFKESRTQSGRRRGRGSAKGGLKSREKHAWVLRVRGLRRALAQQKGRLAKSDYRAAYRKIKGGFFKNKRQLAEYVAGIKKA